MSRRRRPAAQESAIPGRKHIRVVCTDRGQHPENSFGKVAVWPDEAGGWSVEKQPRLSVEPYIDLHNIELIGRKGDRIRRVYPLKCRRCGRDRPLREDTIERVCAAMAAADMPVLDISLMS